MTLVCSIHGGRGLCVVSWSVARAAAPCAHACVCVWYVHVCASMSMYTCVRMCVRVCIRVCVFHPCRPSRRSQLVAHNGTRFTVTVTAALVSHRTAARTMHVSCRDVPPPLPSVASRVTVAVACLVTPRLPVRAAVALMSIEGRCEGMCCGMMTSSCACAAAAIPSAL